MKTLPFSSKIEPATLSRDEERVQLVASAEERARIAKELGLLDLSRLEAELDLLRKGSGRVEIVGRLRANLAQACVVTLERVDEEIAIEIARNFAPEADGTKRSGDEIVDVTLDDDDPPDTYGRGGIDLGALIHEEFVLAIDPFPRAPGATLPEDARDDDDAAANSPFAVLKTIGNSNGS